MTGALCNHNIVPRIDRFDLLLLTVGIFYIFVAPYSKVEESFNIQATHDILFYKGDISRYDHHEFSGVVPRTFIGSLIIAMFAAPINIILEYFLISKAVSLLLSRIILAVFSVIALARLRVAIESRFDRMTSVFFAALVMLQFHIPFYFGRMLPNIFAFIPVTFAMAMWLEGNVHSTLFLLVFTSVVFRCDMVILLGTIVLYFLISKEVGFFSAVWTGIKSGLFSLTCTVLFDSMLWRRWIWPEGEVMWFNTIQNRSGEYGTSPFHWYFTSALPRSMLLSLPFFFISIVCKWSSVRRLALPSILFVFLYSFLPHKELRFILVVVPALTVTAAVGLAHLWMYFKSTRTSVRTLFYISLIIGASVSAAVVSQFVLASAQNYPGGEAITRLHAIHDIESRNVKRSVYVCVEAAMTGVSHFLERYGWSYFKTDSLVSPGFYRKFGYVLTSEHDLKMQKSSISIAVERGWFEVIEKIHGFSGLEIEYTNVNKIFGLPEDTLPLIPFPQSKLDPKIVILRSVENKGTCNLWFRYY